MISARATLRDLSVIFCGVIAAAFVSIVIAAQLAVPLARAVRSSDSIALRIVLGVVAFDLTKGIGLAAAALVLGTAVRTRPLPTAVLLTLGVFAVDALMSVMLGQSPWMLAQPIVMVVRAACAAVLVSLVAAIVRRRRGTT